MSTSFSPPKNSTLTHISMLIAFALTVGLSATVVAQGLPIPKKKDTAKKMEMKKGDGWLGVSLKTIKAVEAKKRGFDHDLVVVESIFDGSPAYASGFEGEDVILSLNGVAIKEVKELVKMVRGTAPGSKVKFVILRGKEKKTMPLLLSVRPNRMGMVKLQFLNKPAPDFEVVMAKGGKKARLADYKGKVIVLDFWATWCGPCRKSIPELNAMVEAHKGQEFALLGVSDEGAKVLNRFTEGTSLSYPVATDPERKMNKSFMINALPTTFLIDQEGIVRDIFIGAGDMKKLADRIGELLGKPL